MQNSFQYIDILIFGIIAIFLILDLKIFYKKRFYEQIQIENTK